MSIFEGIFQAEIALATEYHMSKLIGQKEHFWTIYKKKKKKTTNESNCERTAFKAWNVLSHLIYI